MNSVGKWIIDQRYHSVYYKNNKFKPNLSNARNSSEDTCKIFFLIENRGLKYSDKSI